MRVDVIDAWGSPDTEPWVAARSGGMGAVIAWCGLQRLAEQVADEAGWNETVQNLGIDADGHRSALAHLWELLRDHDRPAVAQLCALVT
jgi:hypothetical protein